MFEIGGGKFNLKWAEIRTPLGDGQMIVSDLNPHFGGPFQTHA